MEKYIHIFHNDITDDEISDMIDHMSEDDIEDFRDDVHSEMCNIRKECERKAFLMIGSILLFGSIAGIILYLIVRKG